MKIEPTQNKSTSINDGLISEINKTEQSFSLRKWFTVSLLLIAIIICGYFALPTTKTIAGSPIGWNEWSSQGQSFQDATTLGIVLNAGRAGLGGGTLGMSEIAISTYNYIQDGDADAFQQHLGGVSMGNLMGAAGARLSTLEPKAVAKPYAEICVEQQNKIPANIRHCFLAGTLVSKYSETEINNVELVPIEKIKIGDQVWSFNFSKLQWEVKPVLETFRTQYDGDIVTINIGDDIIHATGGHPFWVIDGTDLENRPVCDCLPVCEQGMTAQGRWVYAKNLQVGDVVRSRSFGEQKISVLEIFETKTLVYNFFVDDLHNYCVGKNETLVHNTNSPPKIEKPQRTGAGKSDPHGDGGRAMEKAKQHDIPKIDAEIKRLKNSQEEGKSKKINNLKIKKSNIIEAAKRAERGETHWRK
jgi:hypothetical protein